MVIIGVSDSTAIAIICEWVMWYHGRILATAHSNKGAPTVFHPKGRKDRRRCVNGAGWDSLVLVVRKDGPNTEVRFREGGHLTLRFRHRRYFESGALGWNHDSYFCYYYYCRRFSRHFPPSFHDFCSVVFMLYLLYLLYLRYSSIKCDTQSQAHFPNKSHVLWSLFKCLQFVIIPAYDCMSMRFPCCFFLLSSSPLLSR